MKRSLALLSGALLFAGTSLAFAQTQTGAPPQNPTPSQGAAPMQQPSGSPNNNSSKNQSVPGSSANNAGASGAAGTMNQTSDTSAMTGKNSRQEIQQVQQALNQKDRQHLRTDGILGRKTREAIRDFQQKNRLQASGKLDQKTLQKLNVASQ